MLISKKQTKSTNQSRNNSKNHNNQHTPLYSHRPLQSQYESVRNSEQKILKLRGNSKNNSKKNTSQQKSFIVGNKEKQTIKHQRKFSNAQNYNIQRYYINLSKSNSPTSSMSSFHNNNKQTIKKPLNQSTKYNNNFVNGNNNIRSSKDKISHDNSTSNLQNVSQSVSFYSKSNKQNMKILQSNEQHHLNKKKKSSSKGLNLTKKSSNQHSYILEGYQKNKSKDQLTLNPKSARYEKPLSSRNQNKQKLAQKYISFDINQQNQQANQIKNPKKNTSNNTKQPQKSNAYTQKYRKQSIDFQILFNKRKQQIQSNLQSFYNSHRNSFNNLHFSVSNSNGFNTNKVDDNKSKNKQNNTSINKNHQPFFNYKNQFNHQQLQQNNFIFSTANTNHLRKPSTNLNKQKQIKPSTSSSSFNFIKQTSQPQINKNSTTAKQQLKCSQKKQDSMEVLNSIIFSNKNKSNQQNPYEQKSKHVEEEKYYTYKKDSHSQSQNKKMHPNQNSQSNQYPSNNHSRKLSVVQINSTTNNNQVPNQIQKVIQIISQSHSQQEKGATSHRPGVNNNYMSIQGAQRQKSSNHKRYGSIIQNPNYSNNPNINKNSLYNSVNNGFTNKNIPHSNSKQKFTVLKSPNNQNNQSARQIKKLSFLINQNNQKDSTRKLDITSYQQSNKQKRKYDSYLGSQTQTQTHRKQKSTSHQYQQMIIYNPNSFQYECVVGKGGFGKVWKVYCKKTNCIYALKQMSKALIISKKSVPSVMNQQQLLKNLKNPFLVNMCQSFQTRQNLYLLMDFLSGGDLRHHLAIKKYFSQEETKFIIICILFGLKYLHENNIIHRDIKPENIVLDEKGYARITDLGVARKWRENNCVDTSGTPGYMAPEVLCRQNHSYEADYFAVGVIAFQLMLRKRPYYGRSRKQIRDQVLAKQVQIKRNQIPDHWSIEGADFINRMIQRKPSNRLGYNGIQQIFNHPWINDFPLQRLYKKRLQAPYIPIQTTKAQNNLQNYTSSQDTEIKQLIAQNQIMLRQKEVQNLFIGYEHY